MVDKQAADAKKLFDLLFDDVENGPITTVGIEGAVGHSPHSPGLWTTS